MLCACNRIMMLLLLCLSGSCCIFVLCAAEINKTVEIKETVHLIVQAQTSFCFGFSLNISFSGHWHVYKNVPISCQKYLVLFPVVRSKIYLFLLLAQLENVQTPPHKIAGFVATWKCEKCPNVQPKPSRFVASNICKKSRRCVEISGFVATNMSWNRPAVSWKQSLKVSSYICNLNVACSVEMLIWYVWNIYIMLSLQKAGKLQRKQQQLWEAYGNSRCKLVGN